MEQVSLREKEELFRYGTVQKVKQFLKDNPAWGVNEDINGRGNTALHFASSHGHSEIISVLLAQPEINVNQKNIIGQTPFHFGCNNGHVEVVKVLLRDSRVDINLPDKYDCTPLWYTSFYGYVEVIKWMIASGREITNLDLKGKYGNATVEYTTFEIARVLEQTAVVSLLERFISNQEKTRQEVSLDLRIPDVVAAELFAMTVFFCDNYLRIRADSKIIVSTATEVATTIREYNSTPAARFFTIMSKLPIELQMTISCRVSGSSKELINPRLSELSFRHLAQTWQKTE